MPKSCEQCLYFQEDRLSVPTGGYCHRYPPKAAVALTKEGLRAVGSALTPVNASGWCGEWIKGQIIKIANSEGAEAMRKSLEYADKVIKEGMR